MIAFFTIIALCCMNPATEQNTAARPKFSAADTAMVELATAIPGLRLDVRYATEDNFTGKVLYPSSRLYLRAVVAKALAAVAADLRAQNLDVKVFDAYRPLSVQKLLWEIVPDERYVANPAKGSRHNRGAAVDITLVDADGRELDMGTGYDDFSEKAHADYQDLSDEQKKNREILRRTMEKHGFTVLPTEWWHFDYQGWEAFSIMDEFLR